MITGFLTQDTIKPRLVIQINPGKLIPDSVFRRMDEVPEHIRYADSVRLSKKRILLPELNITDTTSVCRRNSIADMTFTDPASLYRNPRPYPAGQFPYQLVEKVSEIRQNETFKVIQTLKEGEVLPEKQIHSDWVTLLFFLSAVLWLFVKITSRDIFSDFTRYLTLRGINESSSRDIQSLFYPESTILNSATMLTMAIFIYTSVLNSGLMPNRSLNFISFLGILSVVLVIINTRHLISYLTGRLSGQKEVFDEYIVTTYRTYRFNSAFLFAISILIVYSVFPVQICLITGMVISGIFYIYRVTRLFLIFIKRGISVLYLFLYLCALEILPALIIIKYLSGSYQA